MTDTDTYERVAALVARALVIDRSLVNPDLALGSIEAWDSIGHVNLMLEVESSFQLDVPPDAIAELLSVRKICDWLEARGR